MEAAIFVVVEGIEGESKDASYARSIEASSWHFTISRAPSMRTDQEASVSALHFVHCIDSASSNLLRYCLTKKRLPHATLVQRRTSGFVCLELTLDDVIVASIEQACAGGLTIEHVTLSFMRMNLEYMAQSATSKDLGTIAVAIEMPYGKRS